MTFLRSTVAWHQSTKLMTAIRWLDIAQFLPVFLAVLGLFIGILSYAVLSNLTPVRPSRQIVWTLLSFNALIVSGLLVVLGYQGWRLRQRDRQHRAGAQLHRRMIALFSAIAILPAILVSAFTLSTFDRGLDYWFSDKTKTIINNTTAVANAYLKDQRESMHFDLDIMAQDLARGLDVIKQDPQRFLQFLRAQAAIRKMPQALIIDLEGQVLLAASPETSILTTLPPAEAFAAANDKTVVLTVMKQAQIQGLRRISETRNLYLYATRLLSPNVMQQLTQTSLAVRDYSDMERHRFETQITFALVYVVLTLVILLSAIWLGMTLAGRMVKPIGRLIHASRRLGEGDLGARVTTPQVGSDDEINQLAVTFNEMASRLGDQQHALLQARDNLDARAQFTEAVLSGVSSGVIGVDDDGRINHANELAGQLYNIAPTQLIGSQLAEVMPEFVDIAKAAVRQSGDMVTAQLQKKDAQLNGHMLRVSAIKTLGSHGALVITFDDVTDLMTAQRNAAWSDIAQRIAHEIKNPLTPIQLSAERLQSKFAPENKQDEGLFARCTETIIRQVEDIGRMVDEFAAFARMPAAVMKQFDLTDVIAQTVLLQRVAHPDVHYYFNAEKTGTMHGDRRLIGQVLTNILKNAAEAIAVASDEKRIVIDVTRKKSTLTVAVSDTGPGWPLENRYALLEPYNTSRQAGTGLGLSIVKKVVDDHGGKLVLSDAPWCAEGKTGATVQLIFSLPVTKKVGQSKVLEEM